MPRQPYNQTVADFVRSQGWKPGDVIAGREGGHIAVLRPRLRTAVEEA